MSCKFRQTDQEPLVSDHVPNAVNLLGRLAADPVTHNVQTFLTDFVKPSQWGKLKMSKQSRSLKSST